jgi:predicted N-acetyltransferase YhbS
VSDGTAIAYLADVYVLPEYRGRGLGIELVRESVERGSFAGCCWVLHTADAHSLYAKFGFGAPPSHTLQRPRAKTM